jgi:hypothetical protein
MTHQHRFKTLSHPVAAIIAATACTALMAAAAPVASSSPPEQVGCPPGYGLGALTFEETLELPRFQAALEAGVFTEEGQRPASPISTQMATDPLLQGCLRPGARQPVRLPDHRRPQPELILTLQGVF